MLKNFLNRPFSPLSLNKLRLSLLTGLAISLFLILFQPFGIAQVTFPHKTSILMGYGGVTSIMLMINLFGVRRLIRSQFKSWTIGKHLLWQAWIILSIAILNYVYTILLFPDTRSWESFNAFVFYSFVLGILPSTIISLIVYNKNLKTSLIEARELNDLLSEKRKDNKNDKLVKLIGDNKNEEIEICLSDLLFIQASGNYVEVHYQQENRQQKDLLRGTINKIEKQLVEFPELMKCHRSYIVQINQVKSVDGNAQGLKLNLNFTPEIVPVSRSHYKEIKTALSRAL